MANDEAEQWLLPAAIIRLPCLPGIWQHSPAEITKRLHLSTTILARTTLQTHPHTLFLAVLSLLHAEHNLLHLLQRTTSTIRRGSQRVTSIRQLLRPVEVSTKAINTLNDYTFFMIEISFVTSIGVHQHNIGVIQ